MRKVNLLALSANRRIIHLQPAERTYLTIFRGILDSTWNLKNQSRAMEKCAAMEAPATLRAFGTLSSAKVRTDATLSSMRRNGPSITAQMITNDAFVTFSAVMSLIVHKLVK